MIITKDYKWTYDFICMEFLGEFLLNDFSLTQISGYIDPMGQVLQKSQYNEKISLKSYSCIHYKVFAFSRITNHSDLLIFSPINWIKDDIGNLKKKLFKWFQLYEWKTSKQYYFFIQEILKFVMRYFFFIQWNWRICTSFALEM